MGDEGEKVGRRRGTGELAEMGQHLFFNPLSSIYAAHIFFMDGLSLEHCWLTRGGNSLKITWLLIQETIIANSFFSRNGTFCLSVISMLLFVLVWAYMELLYFITIILCFYVQTPMCLQDVFLYIPSLLLSRTVFPHHHLQMHEPWEKGMGYRNEHSEASYSMYCSHLVSAIINTNYN